MASKFSHLLFLGTGISFCWFSANSMVSHYFVRWRPIAYAIASSGECALAIAFSPFFQWLIDAYSWQGTLLILGGLQLNLLVCGALMRPLEAPVRSPILETKDGLDGDAAVVAPEKKTFQWSLLRKPKFVLYIIFSIFAAAGFFIPILFLVPFANSLDIEPYWAASMLSVLALADLGGRLACGWLATMRLMRNLQLLTVVVTMVGVVLLVLPCSHDYWAIVAFTSLYGFLFGCVVALHVTSIVDIVGLEGFNSGLGLFMLFRTIGAFVGLPAGGWLVDWTGDFGAGFYLSGICLITSGVFVILVDRLIQKEKATCVEASSLDPEAHQKSLKDQA